MGHHAFKIQGFSSISTEFSSETKKLRTENWELRFYFSNIGNTLNLIFFFYTLPVSTYLTVILLIVSDDVAEEVIVLSREIIDSFLYVSKILKMLWNPFNP